MSIQFLPTARAAWNARLVVLVAWLSVFVLVEQASAIPTFARKYHTSCITCHTIFPQLTPLGEAFRINGYQFPQDDDILVKEEPISLGSESYKDLWPNSVWPSDMPGLPPLFIRAQMREIFHTDPGANGRKWDQDFPHELAIGGAGSFGKDISAWWEIEWEPKDIVDEGAVPNVERAFVQFSNLFAWSEEEDDNGSRTGPRWLALPPRAMNLRLGKMEPQVLPHWWSQHARIGIEQPMPVGQRYFANRFRFEPQQSAAVELHGVVRQYNRYVIGYANGGNVAQGQLDDNNQKDYYFRVAHRWFGYPMDGRLGTTESSSDESAGLDSDLTILGQSPDGNEDLFAPVGLNWWRNWTLDTGLFGWWGKSELSPANTGLPGVFRSDFQRVGTDARLRWRDLNIMGLIYWGHEDFAGLVGGAGGTNLGTEDWYVYALETQYFFKPWFLGYTRYEESVFNETARVDAQEGRIVPGAAFLIRQNMKLQAEWVVDTTGRDNGGRQATDQLRFQLDYVY